MHVCFGTQWHCLRACPERRNGTAASARYRAGTAIIHTLMPIDRTLKTDYSYRYPDCLYPYPDYSYPYPDYSCPYPDYSHPYPRVRLRCTDRRGSEPTHPPICWPHALARRARRRLRAVGRGLAGHATAAGRADVRSMRRVAAHSGLVGLVRVAGRAHEGTSERVDAQQRRQRRERTRSRVLHLRWCVVGHVWYDRGMG